MPASCFPARRSSSRRSIRLARDAELELDDEGGRTQLELVEREAAPAAPRRRRPPRGRARAASEELVALLRGQLDVDVEDVYVVAGSARPARADAASSICRDSTRCAIRRTSRSTCSPTRSTRICSRVLDERDLLLHHPYEAYDPVVALVAQAADDPDVLAIKQTLYRTSAGSPIIASLQRAAERNKQVTVLVELTARFDEERNIQWARALEEAGAHVIYGVRGYKTHAKICLIVRQASRRDLKRYVHLGTGNYNERTARLYTDFGLMTTSQAIAEDATAFFSALTGYSDPPRLKKLVMAPTELRRRFLRLIDRERRRAEVGPAARRSSRR